MNQGKTIVKPPASYEHPIEIAEYELKQKNTNNYKKKITK